MKSTISKKLDPILIGLNLTADTVASTMGKSGRPVIIGTNDEREELLFTQDGVSVAKAISLLEPYENMGAKILISAAKKTVEQCGDGTTLTSVLLKYLVNYTLKYLKESEQDLNTILSDLDNAVKKVQSELLKTAKKVKNNKNIQQVATISAKDTEIGKLFKDIFDETKDFKTKISLEKSSTTHTYYERTVGLHYSTETGYFHPSFMTNKDTEQCIYEHCYVHISKTPIRQVTSDYKQLLETSAQYNKPLLILAPNFSDAFMRACSMNKVNQGVPVVLAKIPGYGYGKVRNAEDIDAFLEKTKGDAEKVVLTANTLTIYNNSDTSEYINKLESQIPHAVDYYEEESIKKRIHKIKQTAVTIYAGGRTRQEQDETYLRIEDAIGAVESAIELGYVAGGGLAMHYLANKTDNEILSNTLLTPLITIMSNANINYNTLDQAKLDSRTGLNTETLKYEDMYKSGIIDPVKVLIKALDNALANTKLLINSSYFIYNEYKSTI